MSRGQPQTGLEGLGVWGRRGCWCLAEDGCLCKALGLRAGSRAAPCLALGRASSSPRGRWVLQRWGELHAFVMPHCHRDVLSTPRRKSEHGCKGRRGLAPHPAGSQACAGL